jgi:hypothetical protein
MARSSRCSGRTEALDEGNRAGLCLGAREAGAFDEQSGDGTGDNLQERGKQMGLGSEEIAQGDGE